MYSDQPKEVRRIIVEGNIGAGKSTFLRLINNTFDVQIIYEPHDKWQAIGGNYNILDHFYTDKERWAYTFQSYAFITRIQADQEALKNSTRPVHILERSVYSDRYCFAKNCAQMGVMTPMEWQMYQEWFSWLVENHSPVPQGFIYLRTEPEVCYRRMLTRNRSEEATVSLEYLSMIHQKHEDWLIDKKGIPASLKAVPVLILECNEDFEHTASELAKHAAAIHNFFNISFKNNQNFEQIMMSAL